MIRDAKIAGLVNRLVEHSPWMAMDVREYIEQIERQRDALLDALKEADGCYTAAEIEGLDEVVRDTPDERLKDLLVRRLGFAFAAIRAAIADVEGEKNG